MRNLVFTTNFHPNEAVATEMAKLVAQRLRKEGCDVTIVDLETLRKGWRKPHWAKEYAQDEMARGKLLLRAMAEHPGETFDWHDSSLEGLKQRYGTDEAALELTRGGYHIVEVPAILVPQENSTISIHGEGETGLIARYFQEKSDVNLSREAGFLSSEKVEKLAGQILEIAKRTSR